MAVIDASSIAKYLLRERNWDKVRGLLEREKRIITLDLAVVEFYNMLWKRAYQLRQGLGVGELANAVALFTSIAEVKEGRAYLREALDISLREGLPVYGSLFIALAKAEGEPLVTSDRKQSEAGVKYVEVIYIE